MKTPSPNVTDLLVAWHEGDEEALERLMPLIHRDLVRLAARHFRGERADHTLQPTALVNEAFLRLVDQRRVRWQSRAHFMAMASRLMRRVLVDHARRHGSEKRQAQAAALPFDEALDVAIPARSIAGVDVIELDAALEELARFDRRQSRVVELRFFGGLTIAETAVALEVCPATVKVDWKMAKAWLFHRLEDGESS